MATAPYDSLVMLRQAVWTVITLSILALCLSPAIAQSEDELTVVIHWPNHGETVYGGPSSLLYKIPIKGEVTGSGYDLADVDVRLELFKDDRPFGSLVHRGEADGSFAFEVTVNPHASTEEFTIGFFDCGLFCHSEGEMALLPGPLVARVTAVAPDGQTAEAERAFVVDVAATARIPVEVILAGGEEPVADVNVSGATWLYMWRSRFGAAQTDALGRAEMRVEALSQGPTRYEVRVEPTIVDGILYRGVEAVLIDVPAGAAMTQPVQLEVVGSRGRIEGRLATSGEAGGYKVHAIHLPDGECVATETARDGMFVFEDMDVDQYLLAATGPEASVGVMTDVAGPDRRYVDLTQALSETVRLTFAEPLLIAEGQVLGEDGEPLPFATIRGGGDETGVFPHSGRFALRAIEGDGGPLTVSAPGYYAVVTPVAGAEAVRLKRQAGTQRLAWGAGHVVAPAENVQDVSEDVITLHRGYLWGQGGDRPFVIKIAQATITIDGGRFALAYQPGEMGWLYLFEGEALVAAAGAGGEVVVGAGQSVNLLNAEGLSAVGYEAAAVSALGLDEATPLPPVWEPTLGARVQTALARAGIGTAQLVTLVTYVLIIVALVVFPLMAVIGRRRAA